MIGCGEQHEIQMAATRYFAQAVSIKRGVSSGLCRPARNAMGLAGRRGRLIMAAATALFAQILAVPVNAQAGFFDQLFGQLFRPPVYRAHPAYPPWGAPPGFRQRWHRFGHYHGRDSQARDRFIVIERPDEAEEGEQPAERQQPVDIMQDESLEFGDAVMTEAGIRIFVGDPGDSHGPEEFRRPSEVRGLSKIERKALAALDTKGSASDLAGDIVTGRSASDSKLTAGEMITDAKGRAIRYVGP
jgi:hypothetical protein